MQEGSPNYLQILDAVPGCYLILDPELRIIAVTNAYLKATMTNRSEIVGRKLFEVFPDNPDDVGAEGVANLRASIDRAIRLRKPDPMPVQKYDIRKPDSEGGGFEVRYWSPINTPVYGPSNELAYVIHAVEDVTTFVRLKAEGVEAARDTEALRSEAGRMEAEILRRAHEVQVVNRELMTLKEELEQRVEARTAELRHAMETLENTEEQLRQSQRLEAIGRLAGGVSHDFNNLLSVILSYSEMILEESPPALPYRNELEQVKKAALRAADLTKQLLAFSRRQLLDLKVLEPNVVVNNIAQILERTLGEDIELRLQLGRPLSRIKADQGHLEQVLMNLVVNARDAMPKGGRLTIETKNVYLDEEYAKEHLGVTPGDYVMLAVSDTGLGMDKATQARAFEPFFTTKARGKGTGLGLSTVFGIVKQLGGNVWLYSEVGTGTSIRIYLPATLGQPDAAASPTRDLPKARGHEVILLVEDDEMVRRLVVAMLGKAGYQVQAVNGPNEALRLVADPAHNFDLLLTDVIMPGLNGRELADRVRTQRPKLPVLFMSGYTDDVILHHGVLEAGVAFVQKPLTPELLFRKIRDVLDA